MLRRSIVVGCLLIAVMVPATTAGAQVSQRLVHIDVTPVSPASGQTYTKTSAAIVSSQARWSGALGGATSLFVEITNQDIKGQDGTLANDAQYRAGGGYLSRGDADPGLWTGNVSGTFPSTPGSYFMQFYAYGANADCGTAGGTCTLASDVFTFTTAAPQPVVAPPPAPVPPAPRPAPVSRPPASTPRLPLLTLATAAVRAKVYARQTWRAKRATALCSRKARDEAVCTVRWRSKGKRQAVTLDVSKDYDGSFWVQRHS